MPARWPPYDALTAVYTRSEEGALDVLDDLSFKLELPPLPHTVTRINDLLQENGEIAMGELAEAVEQDPGISSKILQRVNSSYYGLRRHVDSIRKAVTLLGFEEIYHIVHTANLIQLEDLFASKTARRIFYRITRNSVATAAFTRVLAEELALPRSDQAYTCALLHSIGQLILLHNVPDSYEGLWSQNGGLKKPSPQQERFIFGVDYADLGAAGAEQWHFPESHVVVIRHHVDPRNADPVWQNMACAVNAGWHATKGLFRRPRDGHRGGSSYSEGLNRLADRTGAKADELEELLHGKKNEVTDFVTMAVGP